MSVDREVTKDLIEVLEDSAEGFADAAEKLKDSTRADLAIAFRSNADQRARFSRELEQMAAAYGDDIDESGSALAAAHRVWMSVRDALSGSDPDGVLDAAVQGEEHAVETYEEALAKDISADLRSTVERQFAEVKKTSDEVHALQAAEDR